MTDPKDMSDKEFLAVFLDCSMPPAGFDHYGHVRIAWLLLRDHPLEEAIALTCDGIARLANHLGVPGKYHRTLTEALVRLMAHAGATRQDISWGNFLLANCRLMEDAQGLLAQYFSVGLLATDEARSRYVEPDLLPLPA